MKSKKEKKKRVRNNKRSAKKKTEEAVVEEEPEEDTTPIVNVNKKGQLEDHEGKVIVDKSGKPIAATKE